MIRRWSRSIDATSVGYGVILGALLLSVQGVAAALMGLLLVGVVALVSAETMLRDDVVGQARRSASQVEVAAKLRRIL